MRALLDSSTGALVVAVAFWTWAHFMAHMGIAAGYFIAITRNNSSLNGLMYLRLTTKISGAGFFLLCGATHLGLALHLETSPVITLTDELQLVAIWTFLISLYLDTRRAVLRLSNALLAIRMEYDGLAVLRGEAGRQALEQGSAERLDIGSRVVETVQFALFSHRDRPSAEK